MNFEAVRRANGNLVKMSATVIEIGATKVNVKGKSHQSVTLRDTSGEEHKITLHQGNGNLLTADAISQTLGFSVGTYEGNYGLGYSGFWSGQTGQMTQAPQRQARAFQRQQPASPQPAYPQQQAPPKRQGAPPRDYDRENHGKCFSLLCQAVLQAGVLPMVLVSDKDSLAAIADLATACMNSYDHRSSPGKLNTPQEHNDAAGPPIIDDDIPF